MDFKCCMIAWDDPTLGLLDRSCVQDKKATGSPSSPNVPIPALLQVAEAQAPTTASPAQPKPRPAKKVIKVAAAVDVEGMNLLGEVQTGFPRSVEIWAGLLGLLGIMMASLGSCTKSLKSTPNTQTSFQSTPRPYPASLNNG